MALAGADGLGGASPRESKKLVQNLTEEQFNEILTLMEEVKFESAFMYFYNPREGTPAASFPNQIPVELKKQRLQKVIDLQLKHTQEVMSKRVGSTLTVLADIVSKNDDAELLGKTEQREYGFTVFSL